MAARATVRRCPVMSRDDLPKTATLATLDPFAGLSDSAAEAVCRAAWARLEAHLAASLGADWGPARQGHHEGVPVFGRSRLYLAALDVAPDGNALILIDLDPALDAALRRRIAPTAGMVARRILSRLGHLHDIRILAAPATSTETDDADLADAAA